MNHLRVETEERWAWILLNRPDKRNALNQELIAELDKSLIEYQDHPQVRVIILMGEGKAFCSGLDLQGLQQISQKSYEDNLADSRRYADLLKRIYLHPRPVIAALNGAAIAGGFGLSLACDLTLAASTAKVGLTEVKIGFVPAIVSYFLIRAVGEKKARDLLLTGRVLEAAEAQRLSLVNEVVEPTQLRARTREVARLLCTGSPESLKMTKTLLAKVATLDLDSALAIACEANARSRSTPDCVEGVAAFLEKRNPRWL